MTGTPVAELMVKIGADLKGLTKDLGKVEGKFKTLGRKLESTGKTLTKRLTLPILAAGAAAIKVASDAQEMAAKFKVVFPNSGDSITAKMTEFAAATNQSRHELIGLTAGVGDLLKPLGFTESAAADLSVQMVQLATDLSSFNNMPMDEALRRLKGTLVGSHENALAFGVVINENVLKQELARIGADKLTGAQKEQAKAQARINLLMAGTADAQGDAARTSDSFANQVRGLRNELKDLGIDIGTKLLPVATDLVAKMKDLVGWFTDLSATGQKIAGWSVVVLASLGPVASLLAGMVKNFKVLAPYLTGLAAVGAKLVGPVGLAAFGAKVLIDAGEASDARPGPMSEEDRRKAFLATQKGGLFDNITDEDRAQFPTLFDGSGLDVPQKGKGGGGGGTGRAADAAHAALLAWRGEMEGVEASAMGTLETFKATTEPAMKLRESGEVAAAGWSTMREELEWVNERMADIGANMRIAFVDVLSQGIGQFLTLQGSLKDIFQSIKQSIQQILGDVIALIVKQKLMNLLVKEEAVTRASMGGFAGLTGVGKFLGIGALVAGGIYGLGKAFQDSHKGSQVGSFRDRDYSGHAGRATTKVQLQGVAVPQGDIYFSAQSHANRLGRLGA